MTQRFRRLMALAVETEEDIQQVPGGVWRRYCPSCRGEFLPHTQTCSRCVERLSAVVNAFEEEVRKAAEEKPEEVEFAGSPEQFVLGRLRDELASARVHGSEREARKLETTYKMLKAYQLRKQVEAHIAKALEDVEDPKERIRVEKEIRSQLPEDVKKELGIAMGRLGEPVEVAPSYVRKLQDYVHRERAKGKKITTTYAASKFLRFGDKESFITWASQHGIKPVATLDPTMQYAVWSLPDVVRLQKLLKGRHEVFELDSQAAALQQEVTSLENQLNSLRTQLEQLGEMEKRQPEKISEIYKQRSQIETQMAPLRKKLEKRQQKLEALRAKMAELAGTTS